ncbi:MAG: SH3 domain-containing protein, partial [Geminicoccaceae bacterium]|nr:SH3 domain-containing protein [Geminicoccaceae bacterium]
EINPIAPPSPYTNTLPPGGPAIAISDTLGLNARTAPSLEGAVVGIVPNGAVLPAVGRSADDEWVQVTLPDNQRAWVFRSAVNVSSNIDSAPVVGEEGDAAATTPAATTTTAPPRATTPPSTSTTSTTTTTTTSSTTTTSTTTTTTIAAPQTWIMQLSSVDRDAPQAAIDAERARLAAITSGVQQLYTRDYPGAYSSDRIVFYVGGFGSSAAVTAECERLGLPTPTSCLPKRLG